MVSRNLKSTLESLAVLALVWGLTSCSSGGGSSSPPPVTNNPVPAVTSLSPASVTAGGSDFTLTVNGSNFISSSVVNWNGSPRTTNFVSGSTLTASVSANDIATAGTAQVAVINPAPGGGASASLAITATNPAPTISTIAPASATAGGADFTLTVNGSNFIPGVTMVRWNGQDRTTGFINSGQVNASITASDIVTARTAQVTVFNPGPGGGTSSASTFTINNPAPTISSLSPDSATAGGPAFTLTVNGSNFIQNTTVVRWNGQDRTTTFVSSSQVTASISSTDIAAVGIGQVTVFNPGPGGGTSSASTFTINNPAPTISSLSPASTTAGGAGFTLTVNGSNFIQNTTVVRWNGQDRTTTFVSSNQVTASIPATDIATGGTPQVTVFNPAPGGGTSSASTFTINNPVPTISSLSPASTAAGGAAFTLTVNGSNFIQNTTVVRWNGQDRTTTVVSSSQVTASIPTTDIAGVGIGQVTVFNPAPAGGGSAAQNFPVFLNLFTADIVYDSVGGRIYASVPASAPPASHPDSITPIDPAAGTILPFVAIPNDPSHLAISDDGQFLYIGLNQAPRVHRLILSSNTLDPVFIPLGGNLRAESLQVVRGAPNSVAVARKFLPPATPRNAGVAVYDYPGPVQRSATTDPGASPNIIRLCTCSATIFGLNVEDTSSPPFYKLDVESSGITVRSGYPLRNLISGSDISFIQLASGDERIYSTSGQVIDPRDTPTPTLLHTFPVSGLVRPDASVGRVFFLTQNPPPSATTWTIRAFDINGPPFSDVPFGTLEIPGVNGNVSSFIRWGTNGLAFRTDIGQVFLITSTLVAP